MYSSTVFVSQYCEDLENIIQCYDHLESCYSGKNLDKLKGAVLELSVQTIGVFNDEIEDKLQDCPIYRQLVGLRNSKKALYAGIGIGVGILIVVALIAWVRCRKVPGSYAQTASELKYFQDA